MRHTFARAIIAETDALTVAGVLAKFQVVTTLTENFSTVALGKVLSRTITEALERLAKGGTALGDRSNARDMLFDIKGNLVELDTAIDAFWLILDEYARLEENAEARDVPYEVAYTLVGKLSDDFRSLYDKWKRWDRRSEEHT